MQESKAHSFLFGYGLHIRGLTEADVDNHGIDLGSHWIDDCVAIDGEDLVRELTAVVDLSTNTLVWSMIPSGDIDEPTTVHHIEDETGFCSAVSVLVEQLFPWVKLPMA